MCRLLVVSIFIAGYEIVVLGLHTIMDVTVYEQQFPVVFQSHLRGFLVVGANFGWEVAGFAVCNVHPYMNGRFVTWRGLRDPFE